MIAIDEIFDKKYRIVRRIGAGGFGEVFLAEDKAIPDRRVAIKVLAQDSPADHSDLILEMQALAKFQLPGVVGFYHHFEKEDQVFLVMEYCAGGSLHDRLANGARPREAEVLNWGLELCETLAFVHGKEIVHHDVKPANVLFSAEGKLKLSDFGVANTGGGTRHYLPPELLLGEPVSRADARVDIYALGLTLLETLAGEHPFKLMNREEALQARVAHNFVPGTLPRWIQDVLLKATHPTPELRFQTMRDFAEAISAKRVPYIFDANRIQAHALAQKAERLIARRKWKAAEDLVTRALKLSPDCVAALLAAGRCSLLIRRLDKAREHLLRAVTISPRTHVQKELGWLNLEEGRIANAISLLTDHLQRNAADYEAYNLLLKCFFLSERYEAGVALANTVIDQKPPNDCFLANLFLCEILNGEFTTDELDGMVLGKAANPFSAYNLDVAREKPSAWGPDRTPFLKSKLLFEEYGFGLADRARRENELVVTLNNGKERRKVLMPIVSFGSLSANEFVTRDGSVSRRHALIVNYPDDVWLYDLGSTRGTKIRGRRINGRVLLDGVHEMTIGRVPIEVASSTKLLV